MSEQIAMLDGIKRRRHKSNRRRSRRYRDYQLAQAPMGYLGEGPSTNTMLIGVVAIAAVGAFFYFKSKKEEADAGGGGGYNFTAASRRFMRR